MRFHCQTISRYHFTLGYLGPGGLYDNNTVLAKCTGGATGYIDRLFFTVNHIYQNPTPKHVYKTEPFDPEGILGKFMRNIIEK